MNKGYVFRIYPNAEQRNCIKDTITSCEWVWNIALEMRIASYEVNHKNLSTSSIMHMIPIWKNTVAPWLKNANARSLQQVIIDLDRAFASTFKQMQRGEKPGWPKYRGNGNHKKSYRCTNGNGDRDIRIIDNKHLKLPKLGVVKCRVSRETVGRIVNATITLTSTNKYYVSLCCEEDGQSVSNRFNDNDNVLGIDVGMKNIIVSSDGTTIKNPRYEASARKTISRASRKYHRRKSGSRNQKKQSIRLSRIYEKSRNRRTDTIHKATTSAIESCGSLAIEDLTVSLMRKNKSMSKAVSDAAIAEVLRQIKYKCDWYGRNLVVVNKWCPSTQTCSKCGSVSGPKGFSGLRTRTWTCPECGTRHNRDLNAAQNIARKGAEILGIDYTVGHTGINACGEDSGPGLKPSSEKQESATTNAECQMENTGYLLNEHVDNFGHLFTSECNEDVERPSTDDFIAIPHQSPLLDAVIDYNDLCKHKAKLEG